MLRVSPLLTAHLSIEGSRSRIPRCVASDSPDDLVGNKGEAFPDGLGAYEPKGYFVAALAEEAGARPENDREDGETELVDQVMLDQFVNEPVAGVDNNFPVDLLLERRDLLAYVAFGGLPSSVLSPSRV